MGTVSVSRQYGAGGLRLAAGVAEALGYQLVDREIVEEAAHRLGMDPEVARGRDERAPAIIEEIGIALASASPPFGGPPVPQLGERLLDDRALAEGIRQVIESLANAGGYVILGRGAQAILRGRPDTCHLSLVGEMRDRIQRVVRRQGGEEREASELCERVDAERAAYVRRFYGVDIRDPLLYDLVMNTSSLGLEAAIDVAVATARRKLGMA